MLVLHGGRVLDPATGRDEVADVVIDERGRIQRIGPGAREGVVGENVRQVDCTGQWVAPGFVDMHVHFREPGHEHKESIATGLAAAAAGGFTTVCPMANTQPVNDSRAITEAMVARAAEVGGPRLRPIGAITRGLKGLELTEMADLREAGAFGVSDDGHCVMNAQVMRRALEYARTFDMLVIQHAEDHHMTHGAHMHEGPNSARLGLRGWPREAEDIIVARDLILAKLTGARYHVAHVSSLGTVALLREAKARGIRVSAEVTPHHLALTDDAVIGYDTFCKCNPPLREAEDRAALREALADGTIDCIATDHAPHHATDKECEFQAAAVGVNGLETALAMLLGLVREGAMTPMRLIESLTRSPAKLIPDLDAGTLREGALADVVVIDPDLVWTVSEETLRSRSHNTPLYGKEARGAVTLTLAQGRVAHEREL